MKLSRMIPSVLATAVAVSATVAAFSMQGLPSASPSASAPAGTDLPFFQTQSIGNRFALDTYFQTTDPLTDPATSATVKAVSILLEVRVGLPPWRSSTRWKRGSRRTRQL